MPSGPRMLHLGFLIFERPVTHLAEQVDLRGEVLLAFEMLLQPLPVCKRFIALLAAVDLSPVQHAVHHFLVGRRRQVLF